MARRSFPRTKHLVRRLVALALAASLLPVALPAAPVETAAAAPARPAIASQPATVTATMQKSAPAISPTGTVDIGISTNLLVPVENLTVRLRLRRPNGKLVYQHTEERESLAAGPVNIRFTKSLEDLQLREGRYSLEASVTADDFPTVSVKDRLYLVKPSRGRLPIVIVTRFNYAPSIDPDGRFSIDPATNTQTRDEVTALAAMLARSPALRLSLDMPPLLFEEWRRITSGYKTIAPEGLRQVPKDAPVVATYASALATLKRATNDPRLEMLDIPFAAPDLAGLRSMGAMPDLKRQFDLGTSIYAASLGTTPSAGTAFLGDSVPAAALPALTAEHIGYVIMKPASLTVGATAPTPGVYDIKQSRTRALLLDERAGVLLGDRRTSTDRLLDHLFSRLTSSSSAKPLTVVVRLGPGSRTDVATLNARLDDLARSGWVRFQTAGEAARTKPTGVGTLNAVSYAGRPAPFGYWQDVSTARKYAMAFLDAVSDRDDQARLAAYDALVAESRCWAGPDNSWSFADRGRAFAETALRSSRDVLDSVSVTTQTITLAGSTGKIPISIKNTSGKTLEVDLVVTGHSARFPSGSRVHATLRPADNFFTIPVDIGPGGIYDHVGLAVVSGEVSLASTTIDVQASYLDRLGIIATVVVVLLALLFYIRRKVKAARADT